MQPREGARGPRSWTDRPGRALGAGELARKASRHATPSHFPGSPTLPTYPPWAAASGACCPQGQALGGCALAAPDRLSQPGCAEALPGLRTVPRISQDFVSGLWFFPFATP